MCLEIWPYSTWPRPQFESDQKMNITIDYIFVPKGQQNMCHTTPIHLHNSFIWLDRWRLASYLGHYNHKKLLPLVFAEVCRGRDFWSIVIPWCMLSAGAHSRALFCTPCPWKLVGKGGKVALSSHFRPQNQNKAQTCPKLHDNARPRHWTVPKYSQQMDCHRGIIVLQGNFA